VGVAAEAGEITLTVVGRGKGLKQQLLAADTQAGEWAQDHLRELVSRNQAAGAQCVLTLEPGAYSLFQVERPPVDDSELRDAVRWKIKDLVDYPLDEAVLDVFDVPPRSQGQQSGTVYVAVAYAPSLRPRVEAIQGAGLELERIDIAELSLRNMALRVSEADEAMALIHLGRHRGMVAIARGPTLFLARSLAYGFDTLGTATSTDDDELGFADADPGMEAIALEVQRTADYYDSYFGQSPVRKIRIIPGLPSLEGLASHLGSNLALDAQLVPFEELGMLADDLDVASLAPGALALGGVLTPAEGP
jgi:MSHA biogenesis protein MshI